MKRNDLVCFRINGYLRRAVVKKVHRDVTATIEGLSGPTTGKTLRLFVGDLVIERYADVEFVGALDAKRQTAKGRS